jgi:hypothetical protein
MSLSFIKLADWKNFQQELVKISTCHGFYLEVIETVSSILNKVFGKFANCLQPASDYARDEALASSM